MRTRRTIVATALGTVALLLGACGGGTSGQPEAEPAETRTVTDASGPVEIPRNPQRIVSTIEPYTLNLAALGAPMVGTVLPNIADRDTLLKKLGGEVESVGTQSEPNLEQITALNPDLILSRATDGELEENYQQLSQIAPTVAIDYNNPDWQRMFRDIAEIVGKTDKAAQLLAEFDERLAAVKQSVQDADTPTANYLRVRADGSLDVYVGNFAPKLMNQAALERPEGFAFRPAGEFTDVEDFHDIELSAERIGEVDADLLFVGADPGAENVLDRLHTNPLWQRLDVVRQDNVLQVDSGVWLGPNYTNALQVLDDIEAGLRLLEQ